MQDNSKGSYIHITGVSGVQISNLYFCICTNTFSSLEKVSEVIMAEDILILIKIIYRLKNLENSNKINSMSEIPRYITTKQMKRVVKVMFESKPGTQRHYRETPIQMTAYFSPENKAKQNTRIYCNNIFKILKVVIVNLSI